MEEPNRILNLVSEGVRPSKIAEACNTSIDLVTQQITNAIHKRRLLRSHVLATLSKDNEKDWKDQIATWVPAWKKTPRRHSPEFIHTMLKESNNDDFDLDVEEVKLYLLCFEKGFKDGDMYESLCEIERTLHTKIQTILKAEHGPQETGWWRKGVPLKVRLACVKLCEEDTEFVGTTSYSYTTLINLEEIIEQNSTLFQRHLPLDANGKKPNVKAICKELTRLNLIRNRVMHPIGATPPTEEDFFFVEEMRAKLDLIKWR